MNFFFSFTMALDAQLMLELVVAWCTCERLGIHLFPLLLCPVPSFANTQWFLVHCFYMYLCLLLLSLIKIEKDFIPMFSIFPYAGAKTVQRFPTSYLQILQGKRPSEFLRISGNSQCHPNHQERSWRQVCLSLYSVQLHLLVFLETECLSFSIYFCLLSAVSLQMIRPEALSLNQSQNLSKKLENIPWWLCLKGEEVNTLLVPRFDRADGGKWSSVC